MMTFISCAKTMTARSKTPYPETSTPHFLKEARENALYMTQFTAEELAQMLKVNPKLAAENYLRYHEFLSPETPALPALLAYTGIVFKRIHPADFTAEDFRYAQQHLLITSFLYGLLRPLDSIQNYRLEGNVRLPEHERKTMFEYWRPLLTDYFIDAIRQQGGILVNLASGELGKSLSGSTGRYARVLHTEKRETYHGSYLCQDVSGRNDPLHPEKPDNTSGTTERV